MAAIGNLVALRASLVAQKVKNPPSMQETQVWSLGGEDSLEKGMATQSSIPGKSHGQRSLVGCSPRGHKESDVTNICTSSFKQQKFFFLFKNVFIFSWRIIALQNCVGFCHTSAWRQRKFILSQFWTPEVWHQGIIRALLPPETLSDNPLSVAPSFWGLPTPAGDHLASVSPSILTLPPPLCLQLPSASFLQRHLWWHCDVT